MGWQGDRNIFFNLIGWQIDQTQRTGQWALDLSVPAGATAVPEPGATSLLAAGLVVVAFARRRRVV